MMVYSNVAMSVRRRMMERGRIPGIVLIGLAVGLLSGCAAKPPTAATQAAANAVAVSGVKVKTPQDAVSAPNIPAVAKAQIQAHANGGH